MMAPLELDALWLGKTTNNNFAERCHPLMTQADLVKQYLSAWNNHDVDAVLALMHRGAAIYDAFWLEACVGKNIRQYLINGFEDEPFFYALIGDVINTPSGVVYRYSAHKGSPANDDNFVYEGAVALTLRDGLILTMSDFYCSPDEEDLKEVAQLVSKRHGVPRHADSGLSASRRMRLRNLLAEFIDQDQEAVSSSMTLSEVADEIGCSTHQLLKVIDTQYGTHFAASEVLPTQARLRDLLPST